LFAYCSSNRCREKREKGKNVLPKGPGKKKEGKMLLKMRRNPAHARDGREGLNPALLTSTKTVTIREKGRGGTYSHLSNVREGGKGIFLGKGSSRLFWRRGGRGCNCLSFFHKKSQPYEWRRRKKRSATITAGRSQHSAKEKKGCVLSGNTLT